MLHRGRARQRAEIRRRLDASLVGDGTREDGDEGRDGRQHADQADTQHSGAAASGSAEPTHHGSLAATASASTCTAGRKVSSPPGPRTSART